MGLHNDRRTSGKMPADDRPGVLSFILKNIVVCFQFISKACVLIKLPSPRISWPLFALFLSRVHQVHSFVTSRKSSQAMRPYRQHLLLNKLLLYRLVEGAICDMRHQKNPAHSRRSVRHCAGLTNRRQSYAMSIKKISTYVEKSPPPQIFRRRRLRWVGVMLRREAMSLSEKSANRLGSRARSSS